MSHSILSICVLLIVLALSRSVHSAEASAFLPHTLADVCPLLPDPAASPDIRVHFVWPTRGAYLYGREVQLQVQALDQHGSEIPFEEMAITIHM